MRPKVAISILSLAFVSLGLIIWASKILSFQSPIPIKTPVSDNTQTIPVVNIPAVKGANSFVPPPVVANRPAANLPVFDPKDPAYQKYVQQTIVRLNALEMKNDPASLNAILAEMKNPDKQIREAALNATVQFGDRSAIPALQQIANQTTDPSEKSDILDAIDYMNLPSLSEYMNEREAAYKAAGQTMPAYAGGTYTTHSPQNQPAQTGQ